MSAFSVDLVPAAKQHLSFLRKAHRDGVTMKPVTKSTFHRYLNIWLPLVAAHPEASLVPPIDIAWLWHCHRLAPVRYEAFCLRRFGAILEPSPAFVFQTETKVDDGTVCIWTDQHPHEPVFLLDNMDGTNLGTVSQTDSQDLLDGFNILESVRAQAGFLWQVSGPKYLEDGFLKQAVQNYQKFLILSQGDLPLVPTYQIDLIWHTHMLTSTSLYNFDCVSIRGSKFSHDDSLNDRTEGAKLDVSFQDTCRRWKDAYGENYEVAGGMYRGEPEAEFYDYTRWNPPIAKAVESLPRAVPVAATGASSARNSSFWVEPRAGTGSFSQKVSNRDSFIRMNPRTRASNANPKLDNYVFGRGSKGDGYYSLQTKDAYRIMQLRLSGRYRREYQAYQNFDCSNCLCLGCTPTNAQIRAKTECKERMDNTAELLAVVKTRLTMAGPDSRITLEAAKRNGAKGTNRQMNSDSGYYDSTPVFFWAGAGCGGGGIGCDGGGAACGAACGGGGGGGCGGGGCGGGGGG